MRSRLNSLRQFGRERGWSWTLLYALRTALWQTTRGLDRTIMQLETRRVIIGPHTVTAEYHTVEDNRRWNDVDWSRAGEEWTDAVRTLRGLDPQEWKARLLREYMERYCPRGSVGLEIGAGAGRWSEPLAALCRRLILAELNERCLEICRERFRNESHVEYYQVLNDGAQFLRDQDFQPGSIDFVWSYDVFVHINLRDFDEYLRELSRVLAPGGYGVIHHAGTYPRGQRPATRSYVDGRAVAHLLEQNGLDLVSQSGDLAHFPGDLITVFRQPLASSSGGGSDAPDPSPRRQPVTHAKQTSPHLLPTSPPDHPLAFAAGNPPRDTCELQILHNPALPAASARQASPRCPPGGAMLRTLVPRLWAATPWPLKQLYYRMGTGPGQWLVDRVFENRETVREAYGGLASGMRLKLNPLAEHTYLVGTYEMDLQVGLPPLLQPGLTVYDIGANLGYFSLVFARRVGPVGCVVAFEPAPRPRARLVENLLLNALTNVRVEDAAVSDIDGPVAFSLGRSDSQGYIGDLKNGGGKEEIQVRCVTLDSYIQRGGPIPNLVKIDVEHAEGRVLRGMFNTLQQHRPLVIVELHGPAAQREAYAELEHAGYALARLPHWARVRAVSELVPLGAYVALPGDDARWSSL